MEAVRAAEPLGFDRRIWEALAAIGATGMSLPSDVGGADAALATVAVVAEVFGAALAPVPMIEHTVASRLLHQVAPTHPDIRAVVNGSQIATLALRPPMAGNDATLVPAGAVADIVLALVGDQIVCTCNDAPGISARNTGDLPIANRCLDDAVVLGAAGSLFERAVDEWRALTAVAYAGLARRVLEITVGYVQQRQQFGVAVGTFQAVQHGLADASTRAEGARLLAHRAVWALDTNRRDASRLAAMALVFAAETGRFAADRALQYHGGYGYAEEYDVQLFHRRATAWILQLGGPSTELRRLGTIEFGRQTAIKETHPKEPANRKTHNADANRGSI